MTASDQDKHDLSVGGRVFLGRHPNWHGLVFCYDNGLLIRENVDRGTYTIIENKEVLLHWDRWPTEKLSWDESARLYCNHKTGFTLSELSQPCDILNNLEDRSIHCYAFEGLCNRINGLASAMATGKTVILHWAENKHCPARFKDIFRSINGVVVIEENVDSYPYQYTQKQLCWFYPKNVAGLASGLFRNRLMESYRSILDAMKTEDYVTPTDRPLALHFRHYLPDTGGIEQFLSGAIDMIRYQAPDSVHVASDSLNHKQILTRAINSLNIQTSENTGNLLINDTERSFENVLGMCRDLLSMRLCKLGILCNNTRSSIPDSLRAFGVNCYYTYDDALHRTPERDDLMEQQPLSDLIQ